MSKEKNYSGLTHNGLTADTTLVGKLVSRDDIRIDGKLEGRLECQGKVIIGESGQVIGDAIATNAEVMGKITGNISVTEMLILKSTSAIEGDIETRRLSIEPDAIVNGKCTMSLPSVASAKEK